MRTAICADIHCNWEAYNAVAAHRAWRHAHRRFFLGDLIGYGPEPERCWDLLEARAFDVVTIGNMENAIEVGPAAFRPAVRQAWEWGIKQLLRKHGSANRLLDAMSESRRVHTEGRAIYLHGSPRDPIYEYLRLHNLANQAERDKFRETFALLRRRNLSLCFSAHTHRPGIVTEKLRLALPPELPQRKTKAGPCAVCRLTDETTIINVGSVGQSRDADWRASFVVYDADAREVEFYRVEYPVERTVEKILAIEDLPRDLRFAYAEMIARDKEKVRRIAESLVPEGEKSEEQLAREWLEEVEKRRHPDPEGM